MCINEYCNLGEGVLILGRHVDTDEISQMYHEMVRTLIITIIITTDEALHMSGMFCAKYLVCHHFYHQGNPFGGYY